MELYRKLANHLDQFPAGFQPSETGADIRLLQMLFTPEEAELALHLNLAREEVQVIAARAGLGVEETSQRLHEMSLKGLIFCIEPEAGPTLYHAVPWVVGIYEFQIKDLNPEFVALAEEYFRTRKNDLPPESTRQIRYVPIGESIDVHPEALTYERVNDLVMTHEKFAVAPCICRTTAKIQGGGCDAPMETCLSFGHWADYYVHSHNGRYVDRDGVMDILAQADKANLVLQVTNAEEISFICCCCGCCCGPLTGLKAHPKPSEMVVSPYRAKLLPELCGACGTCVERCQIDALTLDFDIVALNSDRCIGCGLCVTTCPTGALELERFSANESIPLPSNLDDMWQVMTQDRVQPGLD